MQRRRVLHALAPRGAPAVAGCADVRSGPICRLGPGEALRVRVDEVVASAAGVLRQTVTWTIAMVSRRGLDGSGRGGARLSATERD
jgi:hypothetical protein